MNAIPAERERPYSPESYSAQYGITVEDARSLIERSKSHKQIERQIMAMFKTDASLKRQALLLDDERPMAPDERKAADAMLKRLGLAAMPEEEGA